MTDLLDTIDDLRKQLAQVTEERYRLRDICEAVTEEVIEYANTSTPGGKPAEPSLPESIRQMKQDLHRQLATARQEVYGKVERKIIEANDGHIHREDLCNLLIAWCRKQAQKEAP